MKYLLIGLLVFTIWSCTPEDTLFRQLQPAQTGIDFSNTITTTDSFNAIFFEYIYNGGGVGAGDFNGDGLTDLFFTGNQVSSRLYLNQGDLHFTDVTGPAGVQTDRWCTGVALADVNDDGRLDIYVSVAGYQVPESEMANLLFINTGCDEQGIPHFEEAAVAYGLDDKGYSTQGAFLDYDKDGDLDMYLLTNALEQFSRDNLRPRRTNGEAESTDRLYRNNGDGTFTDVSREAGILIEGYGLGVKVSDLNLDGWPDVYTANDFQSNDLVWINNGDGTFTNRAAEYLKHQTHNGMGVDIADFNNDALPDIAVLDMLPEDNYRQKMMIPKINYDKFRMKQQLGYEDQYMRNTVQLHRGFTPDGHPRFSEIGSLTGMAATDWSWSVLFADLDNDGWKDAFITNGYRKDITNLDYINYSNANQIFGTAEAKRDKAIADLENAPDVEVHNYLFRNTGRLQFEEVSTEWGLGAASFSNGAVYADLDLDGDLDLVINNMDTPAGIFENRTDKLLPESNYLQIQLKEQQSDLQIYNTKVWVYVDNQCQYQEYSPYRGYKSSLEPALHFGLGRKAQVDSLVVVWPDGKKGVLSEPPINRKIELRYEETAGGNSKWSYPAKSGNPFLPITALNFFHADHSYSDLKVTRTQVLDHSKSGPALATGDLDGDGLQDLFIGGNEGQAGRIFLQNQSGSFSEHPFPLDSSLQAVDALIFDADQDGDQDLYVVYGGTYPADGYPDRLYRNTGTGLTFEPAPEAIPSILSAGSVVRAVDYDQDGDQDLFVGGRVEAGNYPETPRSYLLRNDQGRFTDVTPDELRFPGMVTDAVWSDVDQDGQPDLVLTGEWMPLLWYKNQNGQFQKREIIAIDGPAKTNGWWTHINAADLDGDGDPDYLVGNFGRNHKLKASEQQPVRLYAKDFDQNGALDPLLSCYIQGKEHLMHERDLLIDQIPGIKRRFPNYAVYAQATLNRTLSDEDLQGAMVLECVNFSSVILENLGDGRFRRHVLPEEAQLAPIQGSVFLDINQDGRLDILTAGNYHAAETNQLGWYDASYGNILIQNTPWNFTDQSPLNWGLELDGDVRKLQLLHLADDRQVVVIGRYGSALQGFVLPVLTF